MRHQDLTVGHAVLLGAVAAAPLQSCEADGAGVEDGAHDSASRWSLPASFARALGMGARAPPPPPSPPRGPQPPPLPLPPPAPTRLGADASPPPLPGGAAWDDISWMPQPAAVSVAEPARQRRVRQAFAHAWSGYRNHAWGLDEVDPTEQKGVESFGMGLTLVDSLDTLVLMGMEKEVAEAIEWIERHLQFGEQEEINLFEVTIRVLGGLLSAYESTSHPALLEKADQLGSMLLFAFHTPHGLPYGTLGLKTLKRYNPKVRARAYHMTACPSSDCLRASLRRVRVCAVVARSEYDRRGGDAAARVPRALAPHGQSRVRCPRLSRHRLPCRDARGGR